MSENKDKLWLEDVILQKIEESAEDIPVPESLSPEQIKKSLKDRQTGRRVAGIRHITEAAAAVALVIAIGGIGIQKWNSERAENQTGSVSDVQEETVPQEEGEEEKTEWVRSSKAGDLYHLASDYDEIYNAFAFSEQNTFGIEELFLFDDESDAVYDMEKREEAAGSVVEFASDSADHSKTNLQVEGVDESDIVKNDGNYLYVLNGQKIRIVNIENDEMEETGIIKPVLGPSDSVVEFYVDDDRLYVIVKRIDTKLSTGSKAEDTDLLVDAGYSIDSSGSMELLTYDISDRSEAKLLGGVKQDGDYYTSRKVDDVIYLFSTRYMGYLTGDRADEIVPYIDGERLSYDCIYVPENGNSELIVSSVNVNQPQKTVDQMMILNNGVQIYMGTESIYLYNYTYVDGQELTEIAKFTYDDGYMEAASAVSVKGMVEDTFAISEKDGCLRILTTDFSGSDRVNQLYLLDENLGLTGQIEDIAPGESIYAARYLGDMAYFITYRNMDPLFAADLSDPENPVLLGSLEITGFSDYLHPYGDGLLLGIGYETDADSGIQQGVKLCMFDITDPADLKTIGTEVMKEMDFTPAAKNYKCVLAEPDKNLIGFLVENIDYDNNIDQYYYKVYEWEGEVFHELFSEEVEEIDRWNAYVEGRGLYAGSRFYLVTKDGIRSYDITSDFAEIDEINF